MKLKKITFEKNSVLFLKPDGTSLSSRLVSMYCGSAHWIDHSVTLGFKF
jgi:hypothetical protein